MHAYFPALNSFPSLLGDMLADAINCLGFTWVSTAPIDYEKTRNFKPRNLFSFASECVAEGKRNSDHANICKVSTLIF